MGGLQFSTLLMRAQTKPDSAVQFFPTVTTEFVAAAAAPALPVTVIENCQKNKVCLLEGYAGLCILLRVIQMKVEQPSF